MKDNYISPLFYIPPLLFSIILVYELSMDWLFGIVIFFPISFVWVLVVLYIHSYFSSTNNERKLQKEIMSGLNINKTQWKKFSLEKKTELQDYYLRQNKIIWHQTTEIGSNINRETWKEKIKKDWANLTFEEKIKMIHAEEIKRKKMMDELNELLKRNKKEREEEEQARLQKEKDEKDKKEKREKEENIKRIEREKENQKILEEKRIEQQLKLKEKNRNEAYKEKFKKELLEKQRKIQLESEAIEELINENQISEGFSIKNKRQAIPSDIKEIVWKRDKQSCVVCGSRENLEFDHNIPVSKGGSNTINNIQILCQKCNRSKGNKIL